LQPSEQQSQQERPAPQVVLVSQQELPLVLQPVVVVWVPLSAARLVLALAQSPRRAVRWAAQLVVHSAAPRVPASGLPLVRASRTWGWAQPQAQRWVLQQVDLRARRWAHSVASQAPCSERLVVQPVV